MAKTLNELAGDLKDLIIELQSDAHNKGNLRVERYNNLKLSMDVSINSSPQVVINIAMSEAIFNVKKKKKINGSLGPDERYVLRWLSKSGTLEALQEAWRNQRKNGGREKE